MKRHFRPGDQVELASGRKVVLSRERDDGTWLAQYVEDAQKQSNNYLVVRAEEFRE